MVYNIYQFYIYLYYEFPSELLELIFFFVEMQYKSINSVYYNYEKYNITKLSLVFNFSPKRQKISNHTEFSFSLRKFIC